MAEYSKKERAELRRLATEAYQRELGHHLSLLDESFSKWRQGDLLSSELSDAIHEFHQHAAREVWSAYHSPNLSISVARAIGLGILSEAEVSAAIREKLKDTVALFAEGK